MHTLNNFPSIVPRSLSSNAQLSHGSAKAQPELSLKTLRSAVSNISRKSSPTTMLNLRIEPEDAHITGATRSLSRRLLALNIRQDS